MKFFVSQMRKSTVTKITKNNTTNTTNIHKKNMIKKIGTEDVNSSPALQEQVSRFRPGDKINVTINRKNKKKLLTITLKNIKNGTTIIKTSNSLNLLKTEFKMVR